jgi:hypothetical protein
MRRRGFLRERIAYALRQIFAERNVSLAREFDKAAGEIGVAGFQRRFDIPRDQLRIIPQSRIEPDIGEFGGIVLRRQDAACIARVRPQQRARYRTYRRDRESRTDSQPFHPEKPNVSAFLKMVCRF